MRTAPKSSLLTVSKLPIRPPCSHMPSVTNYSTDDLKPCMRQLLALQRSAHAATDFASPYLAGGLPCCRLHCDLQSRRLLPLLLL